MLDEVFAAAAARAASLVPETSGYLALAMGDAASRLPFAIEDRHVMLTTEGNVGITKRGEILPPRQAAKGLRDALARLLAVSTGTAMPGLSSAARPREESDRGVEAVVEEIEAALIPVNRAAARRALARLARETIKAKEHGRLRPRPTREAPKPAEAPKAVEPPKAAEAPKAVEAPKAADPPKAAEPARVAEPVRTPRPAFAAVEPPAPPVAVRAPTPRPAPVATTAATHIVVQAKTPPPPEAAPAAEPPEAAAPPAPRAPRALPAPPDPVDAAPPDPDDPVIVVEPTPTVLGMAQVTIDDDALPADLEAHHEPAADTDAPPDATSIDAVEVEVEVAPTAEAAPAEADPAPPAPDAAPAAASPFEPLVFAQPSEAPEIAFELVPDARRVPRAVPEPMTPPFSVAAPPAPAVVAAPPRAFAPRSACAAAPTRADDLLARFGASCLDDDSMREATACLRRIAGIEATPPPARVEIRIPPPAPVQAEAPNPPPYDDETPVTPRARRRRGGLQMGLTLAVLIAGIAGGGALVRLRPELFGVIAHPMEAVAPAAPEAPPTAAPAASAEPEGELAPASRDRLGGTRAERGGVERAR
jgi:hypothetical protein